MSGYTLADALRDMRGYKERADKAESELAALRAELAAMTARAKQAERELRLLADVLTKHETGGPA